MQMKAWIGSETRVPFGRHEGEAVADVPSDYLVWLIDEYEEDEEYLDLVTAAETELNERESYGCHWYESRRLRDA